MSSSNPKVNPQGQNQVQLESYWTYQMGYLDRQKISPNLTKNLTKNLTENLTKFYQYALWVDVYKFIEKNQ